MVFFCFDYISYIMKMKMVTVLMILILIISFADIVRAKCFNINLYGCTIYIDAGHGGKDNGASYNGVLEDEINLSISKLLIEMLVDKGAYVYSSRDGDYDLATNYDKNRKAKDLKRRVELINNLKPDLFLSIHLNTYNDELVKGGQVFYQTNEKSRLLADILQKRFNSLSNKSKKAKFGDYYLLNKSNPIGVLIECGFLTNQDDLRNLSDVEYQEIIVENIIGGIKEYFNSKMV